MAAGSKVLGTISKMFGASVDTAVDFELAMARVGAVSGATGEDFERLSQQAKDLGRETQFSASQAADIASSAIRAYCFRQSSSACLHIEEHPLIAKSVALLGPAGSALLVVGGLSTIGGLIKMW